MPGTSTSVGFYGDYVVVAVTKIVDGVPFVAVGAGGDKSSIFASLRGWVRLAREVRCRDVCVEGSCRNR